ncbi:MULTISPECIES: hypothetical protein [Microcella]|uniref:hypothetical protein n=1 Tax=Microcella TaxID=337004 RepID=UPI0015CF2D1D|nr:MULTISPECIES: hypothetical protein [Microcella]MBU1251416.1 hypothetical protein [Actinomycetota bacterium]MBU1608011.1 hypothetical protein [Actinomycetota bacterium]MBU2315917.1 hypothetical protein [Actinomycetota bacterium]MBU2385917.1 hypothetical protein [Actinomycetota bacterium]QOD93358.1 hypothetical protein IE160_10595 [Chryseoglobus sp. 28M-23]
MRVLRIALYALTGAGLIVNAVIHLQLAATFDAVAGPLLSQGDLFRIQAAAGILVTVALVIARRPWTAAIAVIIAVGGLGMLVLSTLVPLDLTALGLPVIFEPVWYSDKVIAALAQGLAALAAAALIVVERRRRAAVPRTP